jgi:phage I-like protein
MGSPRARADGAGMLTGILLHLLPPDGTAPDWVRLMPAGTFRAKDGRGPWTLADAAGVIARSMANGPLVLDENHATDLAAKNGQPAPAQGWITELQARADGIWGRVEWTSAGQQLLAARSYRGLSPTFAADKAGRVLAILRAALTNDPALPELLQLHNQGPSMDLTQLREALGLAADADETAILAAVTANRTAAQQAAASATSLQARVDAMAGQIVTLTTQVAQAETASRRAAATALVDAAIKAGKPVNALRDHYIERAMADPEAVGREFEVMVSLHAGGATPPKPAQGADGLDATEREVIALMGLDEAKFKETKARLGQTVEAA